MERWFAALARPTWSGCCISRALTRIPDVLVQTPYPIQFGGDDWITVVTNATGTFTGEMTLPDGKVIPSTGKGEFEYGDLPPGKLGSEDSNLGLADPEFCFLPEPSYFVTFEFFSIS